MASKLGLALYAGGNHIFYNIGVLKYFYEKGFKFDALATYSAGGAVLPCVVSGDFDMAINEFKKLTIPNKKNIYPLNIFSNEEVFPHDKIYKTAIDNILNFEKTRLFEKDLRLIISTVPSNKFLAPLFGCIAFAFLTTYGITKKITKSYFINIFRILFRIKGEIIDIRTQNNKDDMLKLILGSSTIYPFINMRSYEPGRYMLDGKMSMLTPIGALEDCSHVISIHAHYTFVPKRENLTQINPLEKVMNGPLDYTGTSYVNAFEQGYREGKEHYEKLKHLPFFA